LKRRLLYAAIAVLAAFQGAGIAQAAPPQFAGQPASDDARQVARWITEHADNQRMPFVIVDKKAARMLVFEADGRLRAATAVLVGAGPGDVSIPGIADRAPSSLLPRERITPAGRFLSEPGRNLQGEDIVWVDYDAKVAIHRLRPGASQAQRLKRLATGLADDKRVSLGCIVVPVAFYERIISPVFGQQNGVVYVLPEVGTVQAMLVALNAS